MGSKIRWVLVADASRARILRDFPQTGGLERAELVLRAPQSRLRKLMADESGGEGPAGDPTQEPGLRRRNALAIEDEKEFIRQIVALLQTHRRAGEFESLGIVAGAPMLGLLRAAIPRDLAALIDHEIAKNYVRIPASDLTGIIRREMDRRDRMTD